MSPSGSQIHRSEKTPLRHRQPPKPQINYSNHQYHLLIANKHHKLLTLCFFEGLLEDFEERRNESPREE